MKYALRLTVRLSSLNNARLACSLPSDYKPTDTMVSFKWRVVGLEAGGDTERILLGGMSHYQFDGETGLVKSIQIDRLVPPLKPGITILTYLRLLSRQSLSGSSAASSPK